MRQVATVASLSPSQPVLIILQASGYMGLKPTSEASDPKASVFTKHILNIELSGPDVSTLDKQRSHS